MRKTFNFGKIAYYSNRKENLVTVEIELKEKENGEKVFTACGDIWNRLHTDIISGGQNLDEIAKTPVGNNKIFKEIYRLWKLYHLNDMHPECIHQAKLGWREIAAQEITIYEFSLNSETSRKQNEINSRILAAAKSGGYYIPNDLEKKIINLEYFAKSDKEILPENIRDYYKFYKKEIKRKGWLYPTEHPDGILTKPCPVCGYKYGSAWNHFEIAADDLEKIYKLFEVEK